MQYDPMGKPNQPPEQLERVFLETLRDVSEFASGVTHEIRNPLTTFKTLHYALTQQATPDSERLGRNLDLIVTELNRVDRTLEALVAYLTHPSWNAEDSLSRLISQWLRVASKRLLVAGIEVRVTEPLPKLSVTAAPLRAWLLRFARAGLHNLPVGGFLTVSSSVSPEAAKELVAGFDVGDAAAERSWTEIQDSLLGWARELQLDGRSSTSERGAEIRIALS